MLSSEIAELNFKAFYTYLQISRSNHLQFIWKRFILASVVGWVAFYLKANLAAKSNSC